ncbi:MAG: flippase [Deltaproteobacteria bacterium]|nr:flippase [Deltaproteobacteria bacterium]
MAEKHADMRGRPAISHVSLIARNSIFVFMARIIEVAFSLVSISLIARYLNVKLYGQYAYLTSIIAVAIPLAYFGLQRILIRDIARDRKKAGKYLGAAIIGRTVFSAVLILGIYLFTVFMGFDKVSAEAIMLFAASEVILSYVALYISIYTAIEKMGIDTALTIISCTFNLTVLATVIYLDLGFVNLFTAMLLSSVFTLVIAVLMTRRGIGRPDYTFDSALLKYFFIESYPLVIVAFLTSALFRVDVFVLKYYRGVEEISLFFAPHSVITKLQVVPLALTTAIFPSLSRTSGPSSDSFHAIYEKAFKFLFVVSLPVSILAHAYAREFIVIFFGPNFAGAASALRLMIWTVNIMFLECLFGFILLAIHEQRFTAFNSAAILMVNFVLDMLLVPSYGYMGASVGTLIAYILRSLSSYTYVSIKTRPVSIFNIVLRPLMGGALMYLLIIRLKGFSNIAGIAAAVMAYAGTLFATRHFTAGELATFGDFFMKRHNKDLNKQTL